MPKKIEVFTQWIGDKIVRIVPILQVIVIIGAIVISILASVLPDSAKGGLIVVLLLFISIDIFVLSLGYLAQIKKDTTDISQLLNCPKTEFSCTKKPPKEVLEKIENAKHSVFISGTAMSFLPANLSMYVDLIKKDVIVTFAYSEFENRDIDKYLIEFFNKSLEQRRTSKITLKTAIKDLEKRIKNKEKNFCKIEMDVFFPIAFIAIDYNIGDTHSSIISAKHYLIDKKGEQTNQFWITVNPSSQVLFHEYLEQINIIKNSKGKLASSKRFKSKQ